MRAKHLIDHYACPVFRDEESWTRHKYTAATNRSSRFIGLLLAAAALVLLPFPALSQDHGGGGGHSGGGGGGGCGDVFGDLIHILRDDFTGQPIFAQRWIELPKNVMGYGWGYCPIAVDEGGERIPFLPYSCDFNPADLDDITEVDYFGRLNGGRTKERNQRMHFDEVISNIKQAGQLRLDPTGRLEMGFDCELDELPGNCDWATVDSPMESMGLYVRLMKYGHLATDPMEVDTWAHGDPALGTQYHPALNKGDWPKFYQARLGHLLPAPAGACWLGSGTYFNPRCATPKSLDKADFVSAATYLGAAANKTGRITVDLVQYLNRFLKITRDTAATAATPDILPALYEDCYSAADPWVEGEEPPEGTDMTTDLVYLSSCDLLTAAPGIPGWDVYDENTNVKEMFVDFVRSHYKRKDVASAEADLILESSSAGMWERVNGHHPMMWVAEYPNPEEPAGTNIHNFVGAASDTLRAIEYIHNYAIPDDLYCKYRPSECL